MMLFYLKIKNIPQITIAHTGNVQGGAGNYGYTSKFPINDFLEKKIPQKKNYI